jgi:hypothetical protein
MGALIVGFDLSLSSPAAVALPLDWRPGDWKRARTWNMKPRAPKNKDDLAGRCERYIAIAEWASEVVKGCVGDKTPPRCFREAYGFRKSNAQASAIMESGGVIATTLYQRFKIVVPAVTAAQARKLTFGFNPTKPKEEKNKDWLKLFILETLHDRFKVPKAWGIDECDAFIVAQFGLSECGGRILTWST